MEINLRVLKVRPHHNHWEEWISESDVDNLTTECTICGSSLHTVSNLVNKRGHAVFSRAICPICHFVTLSRGPSESWLSNYYNQRWDGERKFFDEKHDKTSNAVPLVYLKKVEANSSGKEQKILDVGAGYGTSVRSFLEHGYTNIVAVEPSERRSSHIKNTFGINAEHCRLEDYSSTNSYRKFDKFDYIYLWHVFEHLTDVKTKLQLFYDLLETDGHIMIAVPNFHRESFVGLAQSPLHQHSFSANNLYRLVQDSGFTIKILDQQFDSAGLILVAQKNPTRESLCPAPLEFTKQEVTQKIIRDLDLDSGYSPWKSYETFLLKLFDGRPTNARIIKTQFPRLRYFVSRIGLERLYLNHMRLPNHSMMVGFEKYSPDLRDYIYDQVCVKLTPKEHRNSLPTVNLIYDNDRVPIWLK
jgi:2-polyprenyl-3-methyl-5-hydroxy-6-metoxy-1,4-benzoquinol methylase